MLASEVCVVAGPRGIGKSAFIRSCLRSPGGLPATLREHFAANPPQYSLLRQAGEQDAIRPRATFHFDIFTPFSDLPDLAPERIARELVPGRFAAEPRLGFLAKVERLLIVTLVAPRPVARKRYYDRLEKHRDTLVEFPNLAAIYSDEWGGALYERLYQAWYAYLGSLLAAKRWRVDVSGKIAGIVFERRARAAAPRVG